MVNKERQYKDVEISSVYWDGDKATEIIETLQQAVAKYGDSVFVDRVNEYGDETWYLKYRKPETDEQMAFRIAQETEAAQRQEAYDRQQWERLSKKYGTGS